MRLGRVLTSLMIQVLKRHHNTKAQQTCSCAEQPLDHSHHYRPSRRTDDPPAQQKSTTARSTQHFLTRNRYLRNNPLTRLGGSCHEKTMYMLEETRGTSSSINYPRYKAATGLFQVRKSYLSENSPVLVAKCKGGYLLHLLYVRVFGVPHGSPTSRLPCKARSQHSLTAKCLTHHRRPIIGGHEKTTPRRTTRKASKRYTRGARRSVDMRQGKYNKHAASRLNSNQNSSRETTKRKGPT